MFGLEAEVVIAGDVVGVVVKHPTDPRDGERAICIVVSVKSNKHVRMEASHPLSGEEGGREGGTERVKDRRTEGRYQTTQKGGDAI